MLARPDSTPYTAGNDRKFPVAYLVREVEVILLTISRDYFVLFSNCPLDAQRNNCGCCWV